MKQDYNQTTLECPNCGGLMTVQYEGELQYKRVVCQYCGTMYDVHDTFKRVTRKSTRHKGLLRSSEVVEEVTEFRSDHPIEEQPKIEAIQTHLPETQSTGNAGLSCACFFWMLLIMLAIGLPIGIAFTTSDGDLLGLLTDMIETDGKVKSIAVYREFKGHDSFVDIVAYSPHGTFVAACGSDQLLLWNTETGLVTTEIVLHVPVCGENIRFNHDGSQIILFEASEIVFYDTNTGQLQRTLEGHYRNIALSPDQEYFAAATLDDEIQLIALGSEQVIRTFDKNIFYVQHIVFSPDGRYVVASGQESNLAIWDTTTGRELFKGKAGTSLPVNALAFSPDNQTLVVGISKELEFYEVVDGTFRYKTTRTVTSEIFSVESLVFSPNGKELAIGNFFGDPVVWNVDDERVVYKLEAARSVRTVAFSPDGNLILGGSIDEGVYEWKLREQSSEEEISLGFDEGSK
jgi:WD40 repeat protein/DNA-directed RNA polymerase subunit M/transcription elongation factor TFIIS